MRTRFYLPLALTILFTLNAGSAAARQNDADGFIDVPQDARFYDNVAAVKEKGLMTGISDTEFAPDSSVTRAMLASVLYRLSDEPGYGNEFAFDDVENSTWYEKPVLWAREADIMTGVSDSEFAPYGTITGEQLAAVLYRYSKYQGADDAETESLISDFAMSQDTVTRAELASVLVKASGFGTKLLSEPQKVRNGCDAAIAFIHDDGGKATGNWLNTVLPKYNINASVAIIGRSIDPEYNLNEPDNFEKWQTILKNSNGRMNFAVHSHGHRYLGETDDAESGIFPDGNEYSYEKGHMTKDIADERARINTMFPDERLLAFVKPGTAYPDGKKQVSDAAMDMIRQHYIAMRNTGGEVDTLPPEDIYSVKSLMGTSSDDYNDAEKNHTAGYWIKEMDRAIDSNGMLVYLFHNISDETEAKGNNTARSRVEMLLRAMQSRIDSGKIWNGKFDEIMQYTQEYNALTGVDAKNYPKQKRITVKVTDSISKIDTDITEGKFAGLDMFDYPVTVKVELPYDWEYAELTQEYNDRSEIIKPFTENGIRYIYANVVPDQKEAVICEAEQDKYISEIKVNDAVLAEFEPSKNYYKIVLPYQTQESPQITADNEKAEIQQAQLDENGEGSAFLTIGNYRYEIYFCTEKAEKEALLRIDTSNDDEKLTATKKIADYLGSIGITAELTDEKAYNELKSDYTNIEYCNSDDPDDLSFEFDDEGTEKSGDHMLRYNDFVLGYKENTNDKLVMTVHPEEKGDLQLETFKDQIEYLRMNNVKLVTSGYFYSDPMYVLAIGNSFSDDSVRRLREIAEADGVNIRSYSAYVAGRPLGSHYKAWIDETDYRIDVEGASKFEVLGTVHEYSTLKEIVSEYDWDYITLQGTTHYDSYDEGLWGVDAAETEKYWKTLKDGIIELKPGAKRLVNATWAPINELAAKVNNGMFADGVPDARGAYITALMPHEQTGADICSTEVRDDGGKAYIPVGVAVDHLLRNYDFPEYVTDENGKYDNSPETRGVYRDTVCHLTNNVGRVLAGLVWYEMLTGTPATENKYQRSTLSENDMAKLKAAAHYACRNYMNYDNIIAGGKSNQ